jgi:hypothetical protein
MGIMDHLLPMFTLRLHMFTLLRPMGIGILIIMGIGIRITDRGTIPVTGTAVIMDPDIMVTTDVGGKENTVRSCN